MYCHDFMSFLPFFVNRGPLFDKAANAGFVFLFLFGRDTFNEINWPPSSSGKDGSAQPVVKNKSFRHY